MISKKLNDIIDNFKNLKILVIGDLMVDRYIHGTVERISPEAPVPVVKVNKTEEFPGGAANVANLLRTLNIKTVMAGVIGRDDAGGRLVKTLKQNKIDTNFILEDDAVTTVKMRVVAHRQQVVRVDYENEQAISASCAGKLIAKCLSAISEVDGVIISDYGKGVISSKLIEKVVDRCQQENKFIAVDPKIDNFPNYQGVNLITPNKSEASQGSGLKIVNQAALFKVGAKIVKELQVENLFITCSEDGIAIFAKDKKPHQIEATTKEVYDVTGAGDVVVGVATAAFISGASSELAATLANIAAGIEVTKFGCKPVTITELKEAIIHEL